MGRKGTGKNGQRRRNRRIVAHVPSHVASLVRAMSRATGRTIGDTTDRLVYRALAGRGVSGRTET